MAWDLSLAHVLLPVAVGLAAAFGVWRCCRLLRYARDPRLVKLAWFYGLFAASLVPMAFWTAQSAAVVGGALGGLHTGNFTAFENLRESFASTQPISVLLVAHHVLMLASLTVAVSVFGASKRNSTIAAAAGLAFLGPFVPFALALEAALTLFLAVQAFRNHRARRSPGARQVAAGFLLFFIGHLSFFVFYTPGGARTPIGEMAALVGIILLVRLLPRPSA